ncbi:lipoprotein [Lysobacter helvus]|uniref:Lipoprotein n=2 Tax=Lysobacteraceae TaxID=32033 RepID=A0ABM7Q2C9_9GAMM|nr:MULTISPECIES: C40 family peptidase [Lysobacter]BCT91362.1 lipoprotein [Lysobacter caseinilyticus]BCT94515.1 lipoprotein [Lysobacter helvus]
MKAAHYPGKPTLAPARGLAPLLFVSIALLAGCGGGEAVRPSAPSHAVAMPRTWPVVTPDDPERANEVLMRAISLVGTPYRYGGNSPEGGFDCSGLVGYVFRDMAHVQLPRTSSALDGMQGPRIAPERLAAADLVFFGSGGTVSHVGIYVGEGRFVHAPRTGGTVRLDHLDGPWWRDHYTGARRVLR